MSINTLPDDIVRLVLKQTVPSQWYNAGEWSELLSLLAVCRQWRYLALPFLYRNIFLVINNTPAACLYCKREKATDGCRDNHILTNLSLFQSSNTVRYARECFVILGEGLFVNDLPEDIEIIFKHAMEMWANIDKLDVVVSRRFTVLEEIVDLNHVPQKFAKQICCVFPAVRKITSTCSKANIPGIAIVNALVDAYSNRLTNIVIDIPMLCTSSKFSPELTQLVLDFEYDSALQIPQIYTESLFYLSIIDVPPTLDWSLVFGNTDGDVIFENLRKFEISHSFETQMFGLHRNRQYHTTPAHLYKLCFPKLDCLTIHWCPSDCGFLQFAKLPSRLKRLGFSSAIFSDISLDSLKLPSVDHLFMCASVMQVGEARDAVHVYNDVINKVQPDVYGTTLIVPFGSTLTSANGTKWASVTTLELFEPVRTSMLVDIITMLPNIKTLKAHYIVVDTATMKSITPLSTSLKELRVDTYDAGYLEKPFQDIVFYFMTRVPSLILVVMPHVIKPMMRELVQQNKHRYRHLSDILF
ncbi:hypothetical protein GGI25_000607 [Coemansia spiralis]|uniref:F-box domain-containing protein n=1 Tax=Coemansia spiralis TaxID=417178 RepID=A0A9W8GC43_9FUNG|nr:hypothetical protein GGI26_000647 [Coemansia sp. RSA 1358]KAJ2680634.1 hypothetical protein GGI25_000607 [Coemansia spiralis]